MPLTRGQANPLFRWVFSVSEGAADFRFTTASVLSRRDIAVIRLYKRGREAGYLRRRLLITLTKIATQTPPPISHLPGKSKVKLYATILSEISENTSTCIALLLLSPASPKAGFLLPAENVAGTRAGWCRNSLLSSKWHGIGTLRYGRRRVSARNLFRTHS